MMNWLILVIIFGLFGDVLCKPAPQSTPGAAPGGAAPGAGIPLPWLMTAMPRSGIVGFFDNFGGAMANFGNAQGAGFDSILSGMLSGAGTLVSGLFGSGAINTAFLNYNNRPPLDAGPTTPAGKPAGWAASGGDPPADG